LDLGLPADGPSAVPDPPRHTLREHTQ
jgi:hypothetical protein